MQLGKYETIDQIEAAAYLGTLPFVDAGRSGSGDGVSEDIFLLHAW
jgi:hypothetical protein